MNDEIDAQKLNDAMELSKKISISATLTRHSWEGLTTSTKIIYSIAYNYECADDCIVSRSCFDMIMFTRYYNGGNEELVAAMHEGLINCVDGKFTINKEKLK